MVVSSERGTQSKGNFQPARLDVDPAIIDRSLHIVEPNGEDSEMEALLQQIAGNPGRPKVETLLPEESCPSLTVKPSPGLCVKTRNVKKQKFFINLCKLEEIPAPPPITEEELHRVISEEDYTNLWRVPMSVGAPRTEKDKSGALCQAAEVALNSTWFTQVMEPSLAFTTFVITVAIEALGDKYGEEARLDRDGWTILKNKKFMGEKCPPHTIQHRSSVGIAEIQSNSTNEVGRDLTSVVSSKPAHTPEKVMPAHKTPLQSPSETVPKYKILKDPVENPRVLTASIQLPGVRSARELTLDIGEDRLVLEARKAGYLLDIFLPYRMNPEKSVGEYSISSSSLSLTIPLL